MATMERDEGLIAARARLGELGQQTFTMLKDGAKTADGQLTGGRLVPVKQTAEFTDGDARRLMALRYSYESGGWSRDGHLLFPTTQHDGRAVPLVSLQAAERALVVLRQHPAALALARAIQQEMVRAMAQKRSHAFPLVGVDAHFDEERQGAAWAAGRAYVYALPSGEVRLTLVPSPANVAV